MGGGGFGLIFEAKDEKLQTTVVIKIEARHVKGVEVKHHEVLSMEIEVLREMNGAPHFAAFYGNGTEPQFRFVVMERLGNSLGYYRRFLPLGKFSVGTAAQIVIQVVEGIKILHGRGYIHRDVKPSNFVMGRNGDAARMVYVIDFGLARKFVKQTPDGKVVMRNPRSRVGFRGTLRYASLSMLSNYEAARVDDLWSVFYMTVEMMAGSLPWRRVTEKRKMFQAKKELSHAELIGKLPKALVTFADTLDAYKYFDEPDYEYLLYTLKMILWEHKVMITDPYDWELPDFCASP